MQAEGSASTRTRQRTGGFRPEERRARRAPRVLWLVPCLSLSVPGLGVDTPALAPRPVSPLPTREPSASAHANCAGGGAAVSTLRSARSLLLKTRLVPTLPVTKGWDGVRGRCPLSAWKPAGFSSHEDTPWAQLPIVLPAGGPRSAGRARATATHDRERGHPWGDAELMPALCRVCCCVPPLFIQQTGRALFITFPGKYCPRLDQKSSQFLFIL